FHELFLFTNLTNFSNFVFFVLGARVLGGYVKKRAPLGFFLPRGALGYFLGESPVLGEVLLFRY
ncbi:MAG: hypothetical protein Q4B68_05790, partial [Bacteroidales bacterium]|nr:hypothetical protein [Bacteroidales bacterium]